MPSTTVLDFISELRSLPVPWIAQVAEKAVWSLEGSQEALRRAYKEPQLVAVELRAISEAFEQEFAALRELLPAIRGALDLLGEDKEPRPSIGFSFDPTEALDLPEYDNPFETLREQSVIELSDEQISHDNDLLVELSRAIRAEISARLNGPPDPGNQDFGGSRPGTGP